jgi:hypothetical protein
MIKRTLFRKKHGITDAPKNAVDQQGISDGKHFLSLFAD